MEGGLEESSFVKPQECAQKPEHTTGLIQRLLEQKTPVLQEVCQFPPGHGF